MGARSGYSLTSFVVVNYRQRMNFLYFQDDFKVSPRLTLNVGARYEYSTPQWEADSRLSNFDPAGPSLLLASARKAGGRTVEVRVAGAAVPVADGTLTVPAETEEGR